MVFIRWLKWLSLNRSLLTFSSTSSSAFSFHGGTFLLLSLLSSRSLLSSWLLNFLSFLLLFILSWFSFSFLSISSGSTLVIPGVSFGNLSCFYFKILSKFGVEILSKSSLDHFWSFSVDSNLYKMLIVLYWCWFTILWEPNPIFFLSLLLELLERYLWLDLFGFFSLNE